MNKLAKKNIQILVILSRQVIRFQLIQMKYSLINRLRQYKALCYNTKRNFKK